MLKEFKEFAMKGNIVDLAVAVIIGGAFGAIISSLVDDVITTGATMEACGTELLNVPGVTLSVTSLCYSSH